MDLRTRALHGTQLWTPGLERKGGDMTVAAIIAALIIGAITGVAALLLLMANKEGDQ